VKKGKEVKIVFSEDGHRYESNTGKVCVSATSVVKKFIAEPFDSDYQSTNSAIKNIIGAEEFKRLRREAGYARGKLAMRPPQSFLNSLLPEIDAKEFFIEKNKILAGYELSGEMGTEFHEMMENETYERGFQINGSDGKEYKVIEYIKENDNETIESNLFDLEDGCYPELLLYTELENIFITGQADLGFIESKRKYRYTDIEDYKTFKNMGGWGSLFKYKHPFNRFDATKPQKTAFQLSIYQYMLELAGFKPRNQVMIHHKNYDKNNFDRYDLDYNKKEVEKMLKIVDREYGKKD